MRFWDAENQYSIFQLIPIVLKKKIVAKIDKIEDHFICVNNDPKVTYLFFQLKKIVHCVSESRFFIEVKN